MFETEVVFKKKKESNTMWLWRWKIDAAINGVFKHKAAVQKTSVFIPARTANTRYSDVLW